MADGGVYNHSRSRTTSSNTIPANYQPHMQQGNMGYTQHAQVAPSSGVNYSRRTPSINTFSTASSERPPPSYHTMPPNPTNHSGSSLEIRRSTSSRSNTLNQPTSYVALLRKQKATVWCDRAQFEDPRLQEKQRIAKMRANREMGRDGTFPLVDGRTVTGLSSGGGFRVTAKIRHHGKPTAGYGPDTHYVGVNSMPVRLSATEVEGGDSDDDIAESAAARLHHRRTGSSGRSSTAGSIGRRGLSYRTSGSGNNSGTLLMTSTGSQNNGRKNWSPGNTPERSGSLIEKANTPDQSGSATTPPGEAADAANLGVGRTNSNGSGSSAERADDVPEMDAPTLASQNLMKSAITREKSVKSPEELRRRGSVDERTTTLTGTGRLFIANPD